MSLVSEFRDFINRGNVLDLAVGVVIGGAFGKIVDSGVKDLITPLIPSGPEGFKSFKLGPMAVGNFINEIISFLIIAFAVFMIVKAANKMKKPVEAAPAGPSEVDLLTEIRDALKAR
ncbi:MAG: large conductance mechanosensitive channel protein MscL [Chthonomonas sp.]|nr:large conductance mechanosensitive channel protein MscL [Chthonomonas sp.]